MLKRVEKFLASKLPNALVTRGERAGRLLELDKAVTTAVTALKERGFKSPFLKAFVVARVNPLRFKRGAGAGAGAGAKAEFDETIDKMIRAAQRFEASKVRVDQIAGAGGPAGE